MEKNINSWIALFVMWIFYGIYPLITHKFNNIEISVSLILLSGLTLYAFIYKE